MPLNHECPICLESLDDDRSCPKSPHPSHHTAGEALTVEDDAGMSLSLPMMTVRHMECRHAFHHGCLVDLETAGFDSCPLCRHTFQPSLSPPSTDRVFCRRCRDRCTACIFFTVRGPVRSVLILLGLILCFPISYLLFFWSRVRPKEEDARIVMAILSILNLLIFWIYVVILFTRIR